MSELASATGSVNLGQGFPDTDGPDEMREVAVAAIREGRNQYPPGNGIPELRHAIAAHQRCSGSPWLAHCLATLREAGRVSSA